MMQIIVWNHNVPIFTGFTLVSLFIYGPMVLFNMYMYAHVQERFTVWVVIMHITIIL